jgi:hexosaminidase
MKIALFACFASLKESSAADVASTSRLWPQAKDVSYSEEAPLPLAATFAWTIVGGADDILQAAVERWRAYNEHKGNTCASGAEATPTLNWGVITVASPSRSLRGADESYELRVTAAHGIEIKAATTWGALHALTSLKQLAVNMDSCPGVRPVHIRDAPRFAHRGVMLDPSRNYIPMGLLKKITDGMAGLKLNVLHLDLVNAPSFPFVAPSHPEFAAKGAYSVAEVYSADDLSSLVVYGKARGVSIILEVDTPGHAFSWGLATPSLTACDTIEDQNALYCPEPPCGYMDMRSELALATVNDVLLDVVQIARSGEEEGGSFAIHIGSDEVTTACFGANDTAPLFISWVAGIVNAMAKAPGGVAPTLHAWMEAWSSMGADALTPANSVLQFWGNAAVWDGSEGASQDIAQQHEQLHSALDAGFKVVSSNASAWYLDCGAGNFVTGAPSWCDPYKSWQYVLAADPAHNVSAAQLPQILGGELCLWGEQTDATNLESKLWHRAAAGAERMWAPKASLADCTVPVQLPMNACWKDAQDRLRRVEELFQEAGFAFAPSQPKFCSQRPEFCDAYYGNDS